MRKLYIVVLCCYLIFVFGNINKLDSNINLPNETTYEISEVDDIDHDNGDPVPDGGGGKAEGNGSASPGGNSGTAQSNDYGNNTAQLIQQEMVNPGDTTRPTGSDSLHTYRFLNDLGSSRTLKGKIAVYCFFVDDNESSWQEGECEKFLEEQVTPGLDFLISQAKKWEVDIEFAVSVFSRENSGSKVKYNGVISGDVSDASNNDVFDKITKNMGYSDASAFIIAEDAKKAYDDAVILTIINKEGRSYTRSLYNENAQYYVDDTVPEISIVFSGVAANLKPSECSATIAHELLHLFGAEDYYGNIRRPIASKYYFFDIMLLNSRSIRRLNVGEMTAFCVGWTNDVPALCLDETWVSGRFEEL